MALASVMFLAQAEPSGVFEIIREYGAIAVLAIGVIYFVRGKVHSEAALEEVREQAREMVAEIRTQYEARLEDLRADRDEWKGIARTATGLSEQTVRVVDELAPIRKRTREANGG